MSGDHDRYQRWLDGELDTADTAALSRDLITDPVLADQAARQARLDAALIEVLSGNQLPIMQQARPRLPMWLWPTVAAAAVLVMSVMVWRSTRELPPTPALATRSTATAITTTQQGAEFHWDDGVTITLDPGGEAVLQPDSATRILLRNGRIGATVQPRTTREPVRLATAEMIVEVIGTTFAIAAQPGASEVQVTSGTVHVERRSDNSTVAVGQGQMLSTADFVARSIPLPIWSLDAVAADQTGVTGEVVRDGLPAGWTAGLQAVRLFRGEIYHDRQFVASERTPQLKLRPDDRIELTVSLGKSMRVNVMLSFAYVDGRDSKPLLWSPGVLEAGEHHLAARLSEFLVLAKTPATPSDIMDGTCTLFWIEGLSGSGRLLVSRAEVLR